MGASGQRFLPAAQEVPELLRAAGFTPYTSASGVPAGLAMKNRATERRFRGRRRLPEGAEIQKRGGLKFDLLLSAFLLFCLACDFI